MWQIVLLTLIVGLACGIYALLGTHITEILPGERPRSSDNLGEP